MHCYSIVVFFVLKDGQRASLGALVAGYLGINSRAASVSVRRSTMRVSFSSQSNFRLLPQAGHNKMSPSHLPMENSSCAQDVQLYFESFLAIPKHHRRTKNPRPIPPRQLFFFFAAEVVGTAPYFYSQTIYEVCDRNL
jgi:hypothetical protein